jgi:epoxyqueuosine reductase
LAVCPWNRFATAARDTKLAMRQELAAPLLKDLVALDDAAFRQFFAATPVKRTGRIRFIRNVLIAIGNSGQADLIASVKPLISDASPLIRGAAIWALSRLMPEQDFIALRDHHQKHEDDPLVQAEWHLESIA